MDEKREPAYDYMVAKLRDITGLTDCHISGLWKINLMYQPKIGERIFEYEVIVCQTTLGQGASYSFEAVDVKLFSQLLGKSVSEIDFNSYDNFPLKVAILDSIFSCFYPGTPALETGLSGRSSAKATSRAEIVCSEVLKILIDRIQGNRLKGKIPTVLNIGYVSRFRTVLKNLINHRFLSTDLHPDLTWAIGEYILIVLSILFYLKKEKNTGLVLFSGFISSLVVGLVWWVPRLSFFLNAAFISNNQGNGIFPTAIEPAQIIFVMIPTIIVLAVLCITIGISFIDNKASFDRRNPFLSAAVSISVFALYLPLDETVAARILLYIIPLVSVLVLMNIGTLDTFHIRFRRNGKSFRNVAIIQVILLILVMFGPIQVILDNNSSNFYLTGQFQYDQSLINYGATHFDNYTVVAPYIGQYLSAEDGTHVIMYTGFIVGPKQIQERNAAIWIVLNPGSSEMNISKYNIGYVIIPSSWENSTVNGYHISLYRYFQLVYSDPYYSIYRTGIVSS